MEMMVAMPTNSWMRRPVAIIVTAPRSLSPPRFALPPDTAHQSAACGITCWPCRRSSRRCKGFKLEEMAKAVTAEARAEQGLGPKRKA